MGENNGNVEALWVNWNELGLKLSGF